MSVFLSDCVLEVAIRLLNVNGFMGFLLVVIGRFRRPVGYALGIGAVGREITRRVATMCSCTFIPSIAHIYGPFCRVFENEGSRVVGAGLGRALWLVSPSMRLSARRRAPT